MAVKDNLDLVPKPVAARQAALGCVTVIVLRIISVAITAVFAGVVADNFDYHRSYWFWFSALYAFGATVSIFRQEMKPMPQVEA